jgi:hypothetical protein
MGHFFNPLEYEPIVTGRRWRVTVPMAGVVAETVAVRRSGQRLFRNTFALRLEFPQEADQGANVVENPEVAHFPADRCHTSVKGVLAVGCINKKGWRPKLAKSRVRTC